MVNSTSAELEPIESMREEREQNEFDKLWRANEKKVSWVVFIAFMVIFIGLFTYLSESDRSTNNRIDTLEKRFYDYQQDSNEKYSKIMSQLGAIGQAVGVKNTMQ